MKDFLKVYWPLIVFSVIGMIVAFRFVEPPPPKSVTFAAGGIDGAYYAYAQDYAALMAEEGVAVTVLETAGSVENLALLEAGDADIALLQGGIAERTRDDFALSLGGLFYEPLWVFTRLENTTDFGDLRTARLAIGGQGSGSRALGLHIQNEWGGSWPETTRLALGGQQAAAALKAGEIDAMLTTASVDASYVRDLLETSDIQLLAFENAPGLSRRAPALAATILLEGVVDIGENIPAEDISMVAPVAQLTVRKDLHPAIHALLLETGSQVHSDGTLISIAGTFPDGRYSDLPLSAEARRYYDRGPSTLRRFFSFNIANFLERAWVLLIPLVTLLIPLVRVAPPVYRWRIRRKIYVWYSDLRDLEAQGRAAKSGADRLIVRQQIDKLQEETGKVDVPLSYTDDLYRLRNHIRFVQNILEDLDAQASAQA